MEAVFAGAIAIGAVVVIAIVLQINCLFESRRDHNANYRKENVFSNAVID